MGSNAAAVGEGGRVVARLVPQPPGPGRIPHGPRRRSAREIFHRSVAGCRPRCRRGWWRNRKILSRITRRRLAQDAAVVLRALAAGFDQTGWKEAVIHYMAESQGLRTESERTAAAKTR